MSIPIIFIEGGIGCGKSTLVKHISNYCRRNGLKYLTIQEPVDIWTSIVNDNGVNIIEAFYNDQAKYGFEFQMMAYISRLEKLKNAIYLSENKIHDERYDFIICERSLETDKHVFCKMLYDEGKIDSYGYQIYNKWFDYFKRDVSNSYFVYLKTDFKVCYERVHKRQRNGEDNISIDYLKKNNHYHDVWLLNEKNVLLLDGNQECDTENKLLDNYCKKIIDYFSSF